MSDDIHVLESLPAYAIGSLDEAEAQRVAEHIASCVICRRELDSFQAVADQLALEVPEISPSPELRQRLIDRIQRLERQRSPDSSLQEPTVAVQPRWSMKRLLPVGGLISLLLIAFLGLSNLFLWQRLQHLEVLSGPNGMRAIALQSRDVAPQSSGFVILGADGLNGVLVVDRMPPLAAGKEYQLWLTRDGQNTSAAVFAVDESGYRGVRIQAPESLLLYSGVRVTIEPAGGSPSPTGKEVLSGSLFNR